MSNKKYVVRKRSKEDERNLTVSITQEAQQLYQLLHNLNKVQF